MKRRVTKKDKRRIMLISILLIGCIGILINSVYKDWVVIFQNQKETIALNNKYEALLQEEEELKSEVKKLQDPEYVARYARETYLYSLPGEIIIKTD